MTVGVGGAYPLASATTSAYSFLSVQLSLSFSSSPATPTAVASACHLLAGTGQILLHQSSSEQQSSGEQRAPSVARHGVGRLGAGATAQRLRPCADRRRRRIVEARTRPADANRRSGMPGSERPSAIGELGVWGHFQLGQARLIGPLFSYLPVFHSIGCSRRQFVAADTAAAVAPSPEGRKTWGVLVVLPRR
jgi:hypothetical protein